MLKQYQKDLPTSVSELQDMVVNLHKKLADTEQKLEGTEQKIAGTEWENEFLREVIRLLRSKMFGRRSERFREELENVQRLLFAELEMAEAESKEEPLEKQEEIVIPEHKRNKPGRKPLPEDLPRVEIIHDIPEEEKKCACGNIMSCIGEETSEQLQMEPARLWVEKHIRPKYACKNCEGVESEGAAVKIALLPVQMIPKSYAGSSLLAHIFIGKFCDALPFYRQEQQFKRYGIEMTRATMCNWAIKVSERLKPLLEMFRLEVLSAPLINIDETTVQVLDEPDREPQTKSYMWVFRGGGLGHAAVYYHYAPSRGGEVARKFLAGYRGYVQTDGYTGYDFIDDEKDMIHMGCWAHVRRKFHEVVQAGGEKFNGHGLANEALAMIRNLYQIEREAVNREYDEEQTYRFRQEKSKPIVEDFSEWLKANASKAPPSSLLGKAFGYVSGQWPRLVIYLENGMLKMDNNILENTIRPFVVGRKNWLFSKTPEGAEASALFYSLIETAKANGLEPYRYFRYLFEKYPYARSAEDIFNLLPMNVLKDEINSLDLKVDLKNPIDH